MSESLWQFVAPAPRGLADLVAGEMRECGALEIRERNAGVLFKGALEAGYRACLWSRAASRVLLQVAEFTAETTDQFEQSGFFAIVQLSQHGLRPALLWELAGDGPEVVLTAPGFDPGWSGIGRAGEALLAPALDGE